METGGRIIGIIAECNPFHEGHRYLIETVRKTHHADYVVLVLSGAFVQRGEPAVVRTPARVEMALRCGADAVFLLPVRYATASAELFAEAGVRILAGLGCDGIAFGAEHTLSRIMECAGKLGRETAEEGQKIRALVRAGSTYPKARAEVFPEFRDILSSPNDILGVEYARAVSALSMEKKPSLIAVPRMTKKDETGSSGEDLLEARGSALRIALLSGRTEVYQAVPEECRQVLKNELSRGGTVLPDDFSLLLRDRIRLQTPSALMSYADVSAEIANALARNASKVLTVSGTFSMLAAKNRVSSRIRRAVWHIILDIRREDTVSGLYTQLLGFRKGRADVLSILDHRRTVPLLTKAADFRNVLPDDAQKHFLEDMNAEEMYDAVRSLKLSEAFTPYLSRKTVIL